MDNYTIGKNLYKAFKNCLNEGKDKARLKRIESRLDSWYNTLPQPQKHEFCGILVQSGQVTGTLAEAIKVFNGAFTKITES